MKNGLPTLLSAILLSSCTGFTISNVLHDYQYKVNSIIDCIYNDNCQNDIKDEYSSIDELIQQLGEPDEIKEIPWETKKKGDKWIGIQYIDPRDGGIYIQMYYDIYYNKYSTVLEEYEDTRIDYRFGIYMGMERNEVIKALGNQYVERNTDVYRTIIYLASNGKKSIEFSFDY